MCSEPSASPASASASALKVIKGLYTDVMDARLHESVPLCELEKPSEYYEVLLDGTPCKVFIDVDGEMPITTPPQVFKNKVAEIQQLFVGCESIIGVRNSSHFEALKVDRKTGVKEKVAKISFTLLYKRQVPTCKMLKDYAVNTILPELQMLLDGVIEITSHSKEGALNVDTSVYRTNGKVRCPNAYKIPQQKERISAIVKGTLEDNLIQVIPADCPAIEVSTPVPATPRTPATPKPKTEASEAPAPSPEQAQTPPTEDDTAKELLNGLDKKRFETYDDWFKIVCVVKNENWDYKMFDDICKKMPRYNEANNLEIYTKIFKDGKMKQATLWFWLRQDNKPLFDELQRRRKDFYKQIDKGGVADIDYAEMFYNACPDRYFYSDASKWWEIRPSNKRYYNTGDKMPIGITNAVSKVLRELLEDQRKNLNPLDEKTKDRSALLLKEHLRIGGTRTLKNIVEALPDFIRVDCEDFDKKMNANTDLIAFKDCVYDLTTNEYRQIKPSDFISKTTGWKMGDAKSDPKKREEITKILNDIFPDKEQLDYWWKSSSLAFFTNRFEVLHMLTGSGGNGKGILTSYLKACGGQYVFTAETTFLTTIYKGGVANSTLASCDGVRIVLVSEPNNGEKSCYFNEEFVKAITGRDEICARFLNENVRTFDPRFTILLSCNNKPEIRKLDKGLLRRLSIHPFLCSFKSDPNPANTYEKKGNPKLKDLKDDPAFIKELMLMLLEHAHANKDLDELKMPQLSKDAVNEYVEENNQFKKWFERHYRKENEPEGLSKQESKEWRVEHSHKPSEILKRFNIKENARWTASQLRQAIKYNEYPIHTLKGYDYLRYYFEVPDEELEMCEIEDEEDE